MNGKGLSVKLSEILGFVSSKRVEQMSQWAQRPAMDKFLEIRAASDKNYIVNIFIRLDANYQIVWNFAPDSEFILLYLKSKKYVEKPPRYYTKAVENLKKISET